MNASFFLRSFSSRRNNHLITLHVSMSGLEGDRTPSGPPQKRRRELWDTAGEKEAAAAAAAAETIADLLNEEAASVFDVRDRAATLRALEVFNHAATLGSYAACFNLAFFALGFRRHREVLRNAFDAAELFERGRAAIESRATASRSPSFISHIFGGKLAIRLFPSGGGIAVSSLS